MDYQVSQSPLNNKGSDFSDFSIGYVHSITSELIDSQTLSSSLMQTFFYRYVQFVTSEWQNSKSGNS